MTAPFNQTLRHVCLLCTAVSLLAGCDGSGRSDDSLPSEIGRDSAPNGQARTDATPLNTDEGSAPSGEADAGSRSDAYNGGDARGRDAAAPRDAGGEAGPIDAGEIHREPQDAGSSVECLALRLNGPPPEMHVEPDDRYTPHRLPLINGMASIRFNIAPASDEDWFLFEMSAPAHVAIRTSAADREDRCNGDLSLDLYEALQDGPGRGIAHDDYDGPGLCAALTPLRDPAVRALPAGAYLIRVRIAELVNAERQYGPNNLLTVRLTTSASVGCPCGGAVACGNEAWCAPIFGGRSGEGRCMRHRCGDGVVGPGEACDDGNDTWGDCCDGCRRGRVALGSPCDPDHSTCRCAEGAFCASDLERSRCVLESCGDGHLGPAEECDWGRAEDLQPCRVDCLREVECLRHEESAAEEDRDGPDSPHELLFDANGRSEICYMTNPPDDVDWFAVHVDPLWHADLVVETVSWTGEGCEGNTVVELWLPGDEEPIAINDDRAGDRPCSKISTVFIEEARDLDGDYLIAARSYQGWRVAGLNRLIVRLLPQPLEGRPCMPDDPDVVTPANLHCFAGPDGSTWRTHGCGDGVWGPEERCDDGNDDAGDGCSHLCEPDGPFNGFAEPDSDVIPLPLRFDAHGWARVLFEIDPDDDEDWFTFQLLEAVPLVIETYAAFSDALCHGDTMLALYHADDHRFLAANDDAVFHQLCSSIDPESAPAVVDPLRPGRYLLRVSRAPDGPPTGLNWLRIRQIRGPTEVGLPCVAGDRFAPCVSGGHCPPGADPICVAHRCGDGVRGPDEACDDGNDEWRDGCTPFCHRMAIPRGSPCDPNDDIYVCEPASYCHAATRHCTPHGCGDGIIGPDEGCDDGNLEPHDGCDRMCRREGPTEIRGDGIYHGSVAEGGASHFDIDLEGPAQFTATTSDGHGGCPGDTLLTLVSGPCHEMGQPVGENDDGGAGECSRLQSGALDAGRFCLVITGVEGSAIADYVLEVRTQAIHTEGAPCDRSRQQSVCGDGLMCLMTLIDGTGVCGERPALLEAAGEIRVMRDVEPDGYAAGAAAQQIIRLPGDPVLINGHLAPLEHDIVVIELAKEVEVYLWTTDPHGLCETHSTKLFRVDPELYDDTDGRDLAVDYDHRLAEGHSDGERACSLIRETLPAGRAFYVVAAPRQSEPVDYTLFIKTQAPNPETALCDPLGLQVRCALGLRCFDANDSGDGQCVSAVDVGGGGQFPGRFEADTFDLFLFTLPTRTIVGARTRDPGGACTDLDTELQMSLYALETFDRPRLAADHGTRSCLRIDARPLDAGAYALAVQAAPGDGMGPYRLDVEWRQGQAQGDVCDRGHARSFCAEHLLCMMTEVDGQGICGPFDPIRFPMGDTEARGLGPHATLDDAIEVGDPPSVTIAGHVDADFQGPDADRVDVYAVRLAEASRVQVWTWNHEDGCRSGGPLIELNRIDPAIYASDGLDAALAASLAPEPGSTPVRCRHLDERLPGGTVHFYLVNEWGHDRATDYWVSFRISPLLPEHERCDPTGLETACADPWQCVDHDGNGDGQCTASLP